MVGQAVQEGRGEFLLVAEDARPLAKGQIGGDERGPALVALGRYTSGTKTSAHPRFHSVMHGRTVRSLASNPSACNASRTVGAVHHCLPPVSLRSDSSAWTRLRLHPLRLRHLQVSLDRIAVQSYLPGHRPDRPLLDKYLVPDDMRLIHPQHPPRPAVGNADPTGASMRGGSVSDGRKGPFPVAGITPNWGR